MASTPLRPTTLALLTVALSGATGCANSIALGDAARERGASFEALAHYRNAIWEDPTRLSDDESVAKRRSIDERRSAIWRPLLEPARLRLIELVETGDRAGALQFTSELMHPPFLEPGVIGGVTPVFAPGEWPLQRALETAIGLDGPGRLPLTETVLRWRGVLEMRYDTVGNTDRWGRHLLKPIEDRIWKRANDEMRALIDAGELEAALAFGGDMQALMQQRSVGTLCA